MGSGIFILFFFICSECCWCISKILFIFILNYICTLMFSRKDGTIFLSFLLCWLMKTLNRWISLSSSAILCLFDVVINIFSIFNCKKVSSILVVDFYALRLFFYPCILFYFVLNRYFPICYFNFFVILIAYLNYFSSISED